LSYLYLIFFAIICTSHIIRNIYLYKKGQYNPYVLKKGSGDFPFIVVLTINLLLLFGSYLFITDIRLITIMFYIFLAYSFCLLVSLSILNYLSYQTNKDQRIVVQTLVFALIVIVVSVGLGNYVIG
jgi:hypothetical protein